MPRSLHHRHSAPARAGIVAAIAAAVLAADAQRLSVVGRGSISVRQSHDDYFSISPDGRLAVFTRLEEGYRGGTLYLADRDGDGWTNVRLAPFSGEFEDSRPVFAPSGRQIYFASNRPGRDREEGRRDLDLWSVEQIGALWSEPRALGAPVNTPAHETHPSVTATGALYFVRRTDDSDIYVTRRDGALWQEPERMPDTINSDVPDSHVFVDPAERVMLFARLDRGRQRGGDNDDIYFSVRRGGTWSRAENIGPPINTGDYEYSAKIYGNPPVLYFTRNGIWNDGDPADVLAVPVSAVPALARALR